jgi:hypothetical protein
VSYSGDELKAAVSELVQGTVSFKRDVLGPRDASSSFDELRELVNSTLLYEPDSIFYLIYTASQALQKVVTDEVELLDELLDSVDDLLKPNKPINDVRAVAEAGVALSALEGTIGRSGRVGQSEYSRYLKAIERSKQTFGSVTKLTFTPRGSSQAITDIVRPAAQARKDTTANFTDLKSQHAKLLERVENLITAYDDFKLDELATLVARTQVSRAQQQLDSLYKQLESMPPAERTELARESLLKVLANKSVITAMTNAPEPGGTKLLQRKGAAATYRLSATGTGTAPVLEGTVSAPYRLELGVSDNLRIQLNDETPDRDIELLPAGESFSQGIEAAELFGSRSGPFQIYDDLPAPPYIRSKVVSSGASFGIAGAYTQLHMVVDGVSYEVALPVSPGDTALGIASAINGSSLGSVVTADGSSTTHVDITYTPASPPERYKERSMQIVIGANNATLFGPFTVGGVASPLSSGYVAHSRGWDSNLEFRVKANDGLTEETITLTAGSWTGDPDTSYFKTASDVMGMINGGTSKFSASLENERIKLTSDVKGEGSILTIVTEGLYASGQPVSDPKPGTGTPSFNGAATLGFYGGQESRKSDIDGKSIVNVINEDSVFSANARAEMVKTEHYRTRRATKHASYDDRIQFSGDESIADDWPSVSEMKIQILNGDNAGTYGVAARAYSSGVHTFVLSRDLRDADTSLLHEVVLYTEVMRITSLDNSVAGLIQVKDTVGESADQELGLGLTAVRSTVGEIYVEYNDPRIGWTPADLRQRLLKIGDQITQISDNSHVTSVSSVARAEQGILGVLPEVSPLLSLDTTLGFMIRSVSFLNYRTFKSNLDSWWESLEPYDTPDLEYLDRLLSPVLLVNATAPRVNAVYTAVNALKDKLTGTGSLLELLQSFSVTRIFQVDQALQSLLEQGHNRARALLIKADVAGYLGTTKEDSSYGKAMMKATSAVVVKDVNEPTNLGRHLSEDRERVVAEWYDDKNPLYDFSDTEDDLEDPVALDFWEGLD